MVYLKHVPSGRIYPYNPDVGKADDMEMVDMGGNPLPEPTPDEPPMVLPVAKPRKPKTKPAVLAEDDADADEFLSGLGGK
jgi:hypothetical protein